MQSESISSFVIDDVRASVFIDDVTTAGLIDDVTASGLRFEIDFENSVASRAVQPPLPSPVS